MVKLPVTPSSPRWVDPPSSDKEMDWGAMRLLAARVEVLEKESDKQAAGRGDGGPLPLLLSHLVSLLVWEEGVTCSRHCLLG